MVRTGRPQCWLSTPYQEGIKPLCWTHDEARDRLKNRLRLQKDDGQKEAGRVLEQRLIPKLRLAIEHWRERIDERLSKFPESQILRKLFLDQSDGGSGNSSFEMIRALGFVHVLGASGIHLYAIIYFIFSGVRILGGRMGFSIPVARRGAWVVSVLASFVFWAAQGFRPGWMKPWLVIVLRVWGRGRGTEWRLFWPLVIAIATDFVFRQIVGEYSEYAFKGALHYGLAVAGGLWALELTRGKSFRIHWAMAVGSWLTVVPLDVIFHSRVSLAVPILSFITIPFFCYVIFPLGMLVFLEAALNDTEFTNGLLEAMGIVTQYGCKFFASLTCQLGWVWIVPGSIYALSLGLGLVFLLLPKRARHWVAALLLILALMRTINEINLPAYSPQPIAKHVIQLDVGQGDAALIQNQSGTWDLLDAGSRFSKSQGDWFDQFARLGIRQLNSVAVTHGDEDHVGGLEWITTLIPIRSGDFPYPLITRSEGKKSGNSTMTAAIVPIQDRFVYINAGDASQKLEGLFLRAFRENREIQRLVNGSRARILKINHHGSKTSTGSAWLKVLRPDQVLISVGGRNRYGHPSPIVLQKLLKHGIRVRRTDREGDLDLP